MIIRGHHDFLCRFDFNQRPKGPLSFETMLNAKISELQKFTEKIDTNIVTNK